jgi:EpsI family protein
LKTSDEISVTTKYSRQRMVILALCALIISAVSPLGAQYIQPDSKYLNSDFEFIKPVPSQPWRETEPSTTWRPRYHNASVEKQLFYTDGYSIIGLFIEYYLSEIQGEELINSENVLIPEQNLLWNLLQETSTEIDCYNQTLSISEGTLKSIDQYLITWRWNWVSGIFTTNDFQAKFLKARDKLFGKSSPQAAIILVIDPVDDIAEAKAALLRFVCGMLPSIERSLKTTKQNAN